MKNLPTLRNDSSLAVQFSISVSKKRAILVFTIKIVEMFELHESIRAEYQATIPLRFLIIIQEANVQTINQSKSLPENRVVMTSQDGFNGRKWLEEMGWNSGYVFLLLCVYFLFMKDRSLLYEKQ